MGVCDKCHHFVSKGNDVIFLEKTVNYLEKAERNMLNEEVGVTDDQELAKVLGFEMVFGEVVQVSRHLEPVFDSMGRVICSGDEARMRMIRISPEKAKRAKWVPSAYKRIMTLKEAYEHLKILSVDPFSEAMERGGEHNNT